MSAHHRRWTTSGFALLVACACTVQPGSAQIEVTEASIVEMQQAMESGQTTATWITRAYLARIDAYDRARPGINAILWLNPDAVQQANALDEERARGQLRGPLHGIPVLLKDNYGTVDMPTSGGSLALAGLMRADDAYQVRRLREAGAIILGKTNMHEMASGITTIGSIGGQTLNPYDLTRNPGGSSGGTGAAIAASFAAVGWGSDTCGSIRIPSAQNDLVGLRPTKGLSSIAGILPLSHTQDVGGPLARTVEDLAISLDATVGADPDDPATAVLQGRELPQFVDALDAGALQGARIGVLESYFGGAAEDRPAQTLVRAAIERFTELGAEIVEEFVVPGLDSLIAGSSLIGHEFKWDLLDYLSETPNAPRDSLGDIIDSGLLHEALVANMRGRDRSESRDTEAYQTAFAKRGPLRDAVVAAMDAEGIDAFVFPTLNRPPAPIGEPQRGSHCQLSATTGLPALTTPVGFTSDGLPIGMEMIGRPFDDARLVGFGYAFEQATDHRRTPRFTPPLDRRYPILSEEGTGISPEPYKWGIVLDATPRTDSAFSVVRVAVMFTFDPVMNTLGWLMSAQEIEPEEITAIVLQRTDAEGRTFVIERLTGPGVLQGEGVLPMDEEFRRMIEGREIRVDLISPEFPDGKGGGVVVPAGYLNGLGRVGG